MQATQGGDCKANEVVLAVSLELSSGCWKLAFQDGKHEKPSIHNAKEEQAKDRLEETVKLINQQKAKWNLPAATQVVVVYEAGQDGFWIYRALTEQGIRTVVVDPASIPVGRQARRAKTDRLDAIMLLNALRGWLNGERDRMKVVKVPSEEAEAQRQIVRDRGVLQKEIQQHRDRIRKLLRTKGCWQAVGDDFAELLKQGKIVCHDGKPLPDELLARLRQECKRMRVSERHLEMLEEKMIEQLPEGVQQRIGQLQRLKGIGQVGAIRLVLELFWRDFHNRRQVGCCVGLVPQPYDSGQQRVDQGISKQGNRRVRALLIEMAWFWLRYQPESAISKWFAQRTGGGNAQNKRNKRIAIVAVARRLVIGLWRYLETGEIPTGATLKKS